MQGATHHRGRAGHRRPDAGTARSTGVRTPHGDIEAEYVVNCAGMWARQLGELAGREHPAAGRRALLPDHRADRRRSTRTGRCSRTPATYGYYPRGGRRPDGRPVRAGLRAVEGRAASPTDFSFGEIAAGLGPDGALPRDGDEPRARSTLDVGHQEVLLRPGELHAGPAAGRRRGAGAAQLLRGRRAELDRHPHRRRARAGRSRTGSSTGRPTSTSPASTSTGCTPTRPTPSTGRRAPSSRSAWSTSATTRPARCATARGAKRSPLHERLAAQGAYFRTSAAGRAPDWYAPRGRRARRAGQLTWGRPDWFAHWEAEHHAAREGVIAHGHVLHGEVPGAGPRRRDACSTGSRANAVDGEPGQITYTQWLNERGTLEADLTVTKLADDRFWVVASDTAHRHVADLDAAPRRRRARVRHRRDLRATRRSTCRARARASCCSR